MTWGFFAGFTVGFLTGAFSMFAAFIYWTIRAWINEEEDKLDDSQNSTD